MLQARVLHRNRSLAYRPLEGSLRSVVLGLANSLFVTQDRYLRSYNPKSEERCLMSLDLDMNFQPVF